MTRTLLGKLTFWKGALAAILGLAAWATVERYWLGLGGATHLSDSFPWGLWIGFDVLVGVGLAAGGFVVAATVHILHLERYEPVARPAVLTAFLGYAMVAVALLYDLGLPWNIWHPMVMWNPHSVMFEVAWCVMLYLTVLALEFSPVVFERFGWRLPLRLVRTLYLPLVGAGVLLSFLHQSSLGTLYVIVPDKLHGLWYTPWMPLFFLLTAVCAGLGMTIIESYLSHRAFGRKLEDRLLDGLARAMVVLLAVYAAWKTQDLVARGNLALAFRLSEESVLFWGEIGLGVLLPMALLASRRVRQDQHLRFLGAVLAVIGFVVGRLNVAVTGMARSSGADYFPSWQELAVSLGLVAAGFTLFALAVKHLDLFPRQEMRHTRPPVSIPAFGLRGLPTANTVTVGTLWLLLAVGFGLLQLARARDAAAATAVPAPPVLAKAGPEPLRLPSDYTFRPGLGSPGAVTFSHASHIGAADRGCATCHQHDFSIRRAGTPLAGGLRMERMRQGELCGRCHDGAAAFAIADNCDYCHQ